VEDLIPDAIFKAIDHDNLAIDRDSFLYWFVTWRQMFIEKLLPLPLPMIARMLPYTHAGWNTLKGGGDTFTKKFAKMDDDCQERVAIRSVTTLVCTRIILNIGLVTHRCLQMDSGG
jgi:hypothetical protein